MKITKEASVFYFTFAMLKASKHYLEYLIDSKSVSQNLKYDLKILVNKIGWLERCCENSVESEDAKTWKREWTEKDYQVFANVFGMMNDMDEERRAVLEQFTEQLAAGNIKVEMGNN